MFHYHDSGMESGATVQEGRVKIQSLSFIDYA
jgi:hypothetical protein